MAITLTYNDATITLRRALVGDRLHADVIGSRLAGKDGYDSNFAYPFRTFARFVTQAQIEGDFAFALPAFDAPIDKLKAAYEAFTQMDEAFYDEVLLALDDVTAPPEPKKTRKKT